MTRKITFRFGFTSKTKRVNGRFVVINSAEEVILESVLDTNKIDATFESVGGLEEQKRILTEHVKWPFIHSEMFGANSLRSYPKGVLLHGPPGTGKTLLVRALAKELNCTFINVKTDLLFSRWLGETEKNCAAVFSLAEKLSPTIIFIDEIDSLLGCRNSLDDGSRNHAKTIFMTSWDGITGIQGKVVVVGATNRLNSIDEAIRRRLPLQIEVPRPDPDTRKSILDILLRQDIKSTSEREAMLNYVVAKTDGYTGSDLSELCKAAALLTLREISDGGKFPDLGKRHFDEAFKRIKPSC
ncbi:Holliday junction DNA helicase ruvB N terminus domain AAA domain [Trypanosoma vivax]|nr:hypothetical protein TRVL_02616 [Trypanosoma vivax]KAH8613798.1 Holliday junction DNA helicase ruvB N terminus domain AAA domain [Trypanosoma vivax]